MANPSPAKVSVECPHCGFKQMEYAAAKSSICRQCGRYFSPFAAKPTLKLHVKDETLAPDISSFRERIGGFWKRQQNSLVECFECRRKQQVSGSATSTICPACGGHIDLRDYEINTTFSRTIRTRGDVHIMPKGDLSSNSVTCRSALIEGKLRGNLHCDDIATINFSGKIPGRLGAKHVTVERKANIQCFRRFQVGSIEIKGRMVGDVIAETAVTINKKGSLEGNVTAKAITVEKGGMFSGQLVIGPADLTQGELLPERKSGAASGPPDISGAVARPLPAT